MNMNSFNMYILENEVDGEGFLMLTEEDFSTMIKPLGARRKLISKQNRLQVKTPKNVSDSLW